MCSLFDRIRLGCFGLAVLALPTAATSSYAAVPVADTPFAQEYRDAFLLTDRPESNDIRAIELDRQGRLWIATAQGVYYRAGDRWQPAHAELADGASYALAQDASGVIWIGHWRGLYRADATKSEVVTAPVAEIRVPIGAIACAGARVIAGGPDGYWERTDETFAPLKGPWATSVQAILIDGEDLWIGTQTALFHTSGGNTRQLHNADEILTCHVSSLARAADGRIWVGTGGGLDVFEKGKRVASYTGREGLPSARINSLDFDKQGTLWIGTPIGLVRYDGERWTLRNSLRWLPNDSVRGVAFTEKGPAWVATAGGLSPLSKRTMTLAEKAAYFEDVVRKRHVRAPGLVRKCRLKTPGDLSTFEPTDTDNDGLFSSLYLAAESYRYAATKDPQARKNAAEVYRGLEFLQTVTDTPGFVARTVIPADWTSMADRNRTYTAEQAADERVQDPRFKRVENRWRKSADGRWLWKGDTSSDEISGHYFGYAVYYDLAADDAERARIREHVRRITDYIIDGGFVLRDIDGQSTLWGVWAPEKLNDDPNWFSERGINSLEILSFLRVAHHMTGDKRYADLIERLLTQHNYRENIKVPKLASPGEFTFIDDQLLALCYRAVFAYSPGDADRALFRPGLDQWHRVVRDMHSPLYDFVYEVASGDPTEVPQAVAYLQDVPLDLLNWSMDNSRREDLDVVGRPQTRRYLINRLLPPSERPVIQWDGNPYQFRDGGGGGEECEPHFWLLPYWMGRHHGLLAPPAPAKS